MSSQPEEPKEESPQPFLRPISPNLQLDGQEKDVKPVWKRNYSKKVLPVVPIEEHSTGKTSMYIVAGEGPHREGQPGFAVIGRKNKALKGKASLEFTGDLKTMEDGWSDEETTSGRRLVKLYRRQTGAKIEVHFHPIVPQDYDPTSVVISCIWNEKLQTKVATYSDIIYSLTSILLSTLGPEELSRIDRLLEFYEPDSYVVRAPVHLPPSFFNIPDVSDPNQSDDEGDELGGGTGGGGSAFYAKVVGFDDPKPRKKEREIRFYPWRLMEAILKSLVPTYRPYTYSFRPTYPNLPLFNRSLGISSISHPYSAGQQPLKLHHGTFPIAPVPPSHLFEPHQVEGLNAPRPVSPPPAPSGSGSRNRRTSTGSGAGGAGKRKRGTKVEAGFRKEEDGSSQVPSKVVRPSRTRKQKTPQAQLDEGEEEDDHEEVLRLELEDDEEDPAPPPSSKRKAKKKAVLANDYDTYEDEDEDLLVIIEEEPSEEEEGPRKKRGRGDGGRRRS